MMSSEKIDQDLTFAPITSVRWPDVVRLFEGHGNPGYCWCMRWRARASTFQKLGREGRKDALHDLVEAGTSVGILAYLAGEPVGWCSVAPRDTYQALEHSRVLKRFDNASTWAIVCFFVKRTVRGRHLSLALLNAAVAYALAHGAEAVEGYPVDRDATSYQFMGLVSTFEKAGFRDVTPKEGGRRIMRFAPESERQPSLPRSTTWLD